MELLSSPVLTEPSQILLLLLILLKCALKNYLAERDFLVKRLRYCFCFVLNILGTIWWLWVKNDVHVLGPSRHFRNV